MTRRPRFFATSATELTLDRLAALVPAACMAIGCAGLIVLLVAIVAGAGAGVSP